MTVNELLSGGGVIGAVVVLLALVEISPIKINPWSAIGKAIGRAINGDVIEKLEATRKTLDDHIRTDDARNADMHRAAILRFNNELLRDIPHTREEFIEVLSEILRTVLRKSPGLQKQPRRSRGCQYQAGVRRPLD